MVPIVVLPPEGSLQGARSSKRAHSYSVAHFAFAQTYEAKDVPVEWQADIGERLARYDYKFHAVFTDDNPNHLLFADPPRSRSIASIACSGSVPPTKSRNASAGCLRRLT